MDKTQLLPQALCTLHKVSTVRDHMFTNAVVQELAEQETISRLFMLESYLNRI